MSTCTALQKSDGKKCTKPAKYGDKCGIHKGKEVKTPVKTNRSPRKTQPKTPEVQCNATKISGEPCTKPAKYGDKCGIHKGKEVKTPVKTNRNSVKTQFNDHIFPKVIERKIGEYIDITEFNLKDSNLSEFKYLVENFQGTINPENFPKFMEKLCKTNSIESVKYLKKAFNESPCLNDSEYITVDTLHYLVNTGNIDMLNMIIDIYNLDLTNDVIRYFYYEPSNGFSELNINLFENCSRDMLLFIFDKMEELDQVDSFRHFYSVKNVWGKRFPELNKMYETLFIRGDADLLIHIHNIIGNFAEDFYGGDYDKHTDLDSLLVLFLYKDDLKMTNFILESGTMLMMGELDQWDGFGIQGILRDKCEEGKLSTLKFIFEKGLYKVDGKPNLQELIAIACINGHLEIAKYIAKRIKKKKTLYKGNTMNIVYAKTIKNGHPEEAIWLAKYFRIDTSIDLDEYVKGKEIWVDVNEEEESD
jgi:hypothetical protein